MADGGCIAMLLRPYHAWPCTTPTHDSLEPRIAFVSLRPRRAGSATLPHLSPHHQHLPPHPWPTYRHIHCRWYADGASISLGVGGHPCIAATTTRSLPPPQSLQRRALAASSAAAIAPCHHHIHPAHHHSYHTALSRHRPPPRPLTFLPTPLLWQRTRGTLPPKAPKASGSDQTTSRGDRRAIHRDAQVLGESWGARATRGDHGLVGRAVH